MRVDPDIKDLLIHLRGEKTNLLHDIAIFLGNVLK
jgi:hypothetical protein